MTVIVTVYRFGTLIGVSFLGGPLIGVVISLVVGAALVIGASIYQIKLVDGGWVPGAKRDARLAAEQAEVDAAKATTAS